jgi:signal transduction histidine kinase
VNNLLQFPAPPVLAKDGSERHHVGAAFLAQPDPHSHAVQFYENEEFLFDTVGHFLAAGMKLGECLVVIATPEHRDGFLARLDADDTERAVASGKLVALDARATLARFMVGGMPDPDLFHDVIGRLLVDVAGDAETPPRVRAYGEMVDLLWRDGNSTGAIRLEELWNDAGKQHSFELLCAYSMGNFYKEGEAARFMEVCRTHSHVIPTESFAQLEDSHARLREIALLQQRAHALESEIEHRKGLESALRDALRERADAEKALRVSLKREKEARAQAEASDAFKEVFLGILGHDLRNPLNTVLTTAQMMAIGDGLPAESNKRVHRIVSSSMRMARMIEQILDVTRARLATGIPIHRSATPDLVPLVTKIVDEVQAANPQCRFVIEGQGPCPASVDADRIEQVVSNLLCNAVVHGDPQQPIRIEVVRRKRATLVAVHNHGKSIDPAFMPILFDPFQRERPAGRSEGLGLGLYISERIVAAHGGTISVTSSAEAGTRFEVLLPHTDP